MNKTYYYARVSTKEQNLDRQIQAFKDIGADGKDIITDKESGKDLNRLGYKYLKNMLLRDGDTLVIKSLDRLSRNKQDIKNELEYFRQHKIKLKVIDIATTMLDFPKEQFWIEDMVTNVIIEIYASIAENERNTMRQRQAEGIAAAKANGKNLGRKAIEYPKNFESVYTAWKNKSITAAEAMKQLGLKRTNFYMMVKKYEINNQERV